jgi:hypothetical protein
MLLPRQSYGAKRTKCVWLLVTDAGDDLIGSVPPGVRVLLGPERMRPVHREVSASLREHNLSIVDQQRLN